MAAGNSVAPVIIKRKKVVGGGGHHGGAWKVAYADFVTAMMAFFMLMWLLNATTEKQRKGIADYFNPNIPINRISGGGDGAFGGDSIFSENTLARSETGASGKNPPWISAAESANSQGAERSKAEALLSDVSSNLLGGGGESDLLENALKHVTPRISDEGVVIEVYDLPESPLFTSDGHVSTVMKTLLTRIASIASKVDNPIAIAAHARTEPVVRANVDLWKTTSLRSLEVASQLRFSGIPNDRVDRLIGHADTERYESDPLSVRNNRVEITFLLEGQSN